MTIKIHRRRRTIGARLMPWFEGAATLVMAVWALILLVAVAAAVGIYLVAFIIVVPVLIMLIHWRRIDWKSLFRLGGK